MEHIGTLVEPYGTVVDFGLSGGDHYFWFLSSEGRTFMIPAAGVPL